MARRGRNERAGSLIWPGFVDAMTALLLVVMFVLSIFMIVQFVLREELTGKNRTLDALTGQLASLTDELNIAQDDNTQLRGEATRLSDLLTSERMSSQELRDALDLSQAEGERMAAELAERIAQITQVTESAARDRAQLQNATALIASLTAERDDAATALTQLQDANARASEINDENARLRAEAEAVRRRLAAAAGEDPESSALTVDEQIAALELALDQRREEAEQTLLLLAAAEERAESLSLEARANAQAMSLEERLAAFASASLAVEQDLNEQSRVAVALLNTQVQTLRGELSALRLQLDAAENRDAESQLEIADLGERLNRALAERVNELEQYRSDFFGRLRGVLGDTEGVRIVGDRFVFQAEVLFDSGSADLGPEGQDELARFAGILRDVSGDIPEEVNWILRVDGHSDVTPLGSNSPFASNWELSQARALSVVQFLTDELDFPPERLAANGFGEFQPIDPRETSQAYARNRRIELKLTER